MTRLARFAVVVALLASAGCSDDSAGSGPIAANSGFDIEHSSLKFRNFGGFVKSAVFDRKSAHRMFGDKACQKMSDNRCVLKPSVKIMVARINKAARGGRCEGFAVVAGLYHTKRLDFSQLGIDQPLYELDRSALPVLDRELMYWYATQFAAPVKRATARFSATEAVARLGASFRAKDGESFRIGMMKLDAKGRRSGGHAVMPYATRRVSGSSWEIVVYDSNHPGERRAITVDVNEDTWQYNASSNPNEEESVYNGGPGKKNRLYLIPNSSRLGTLPCPGCGNSQDTTVLADGRARFTVVNSKGEKTRSDQDDGDKIPGSTSSPAFTQSLWSDDAPVSIDIPAAGGLSIVAEPAPDAGDGDGESIDLALLMPDGGFAAATAMVTKGAQTLKVSDNGSVAFESEDGSAATVSVGTVGDDGETHMVSVKVDGGADKTAVTVEVADDGKSAKVDLPEGGTVTFTVESESATGSSKFKGTVKLKKGSTVKVPTVTKAGENVEVEVDESGDGKADKKLSVKPCSEDPACDKGSEDADSDDDGDGVPGDQDNCAGDANPGQADLDGDGKGDACDDDADGDGMPAGTDCDDLDPTKIAGCGKDPAKPQCAAAKDCPQPAGASCLLATCVDAKCGIKPAGDGAACDDGDACSTGATCKGSECAGGSAKDCDDDNPCTADGCKDGACASAATGGLCDDGDACTSADECAAGACKGNAVTECDDGNACTDDSCDKKKGCETAANKAACDDGNVCTTTDACVDKLCSGSGALKCDDGNVCTTDGCSAKSGCVAVANTLDCDDGSKCTAQSACESATCASGALVSCDDTNPCTQDNCAAKTGCSSLPTAATCTDNNACSSGDACGDGKCKPGATVNCDDGNACTDDACAPKTGCEYAPNTAACDDGNACTTNDACTTGKCTAGKPVDCAAPEQHKVTFDIAHPPNLPQWVEDGVLVSAPGGPFKGAIGVANWDSSDTDLETAVPNNGGQIRVEMTDGGVFALISLHGSGGTGTVTIAGGKKAGGTVTHKTSHTASGSTITLPTTFTDLVWATITSANSGGGANNHHYDDVVVLAAPTLPVCRTASTCDAKSGKCAAITAKDGASCDDGDQCTSDGACTAGKCVGKQVCTLLITSSKDTDDGTCNFQHCTLREAVTQANKKSDADTIHFAANLNVWLSKELPAVIEPLTIDGGTHVVAIDGATKFRVLHTKNDVTLRNVTISNGNGGAGFGGGVWAADKGELVVDGVKFVGNVAGAGGGGLYSAVKVKATGCTFNGNKATLVGKAFGGGIRLDGVGTISDCVFTNNVSALYGGGLYVHNKAVATVTGTTFTGNKAANGGAVLSFGASTKIANTTMVANIATVMGGAVATNAPAGGTMDLRNCTIVGNSAPKLAGVEFNGVFRLFNTVIAGAKGGGADCGGQNGQSPTLSTASFVQDGTCKADYKGDPKLGTFGDNGGKTQTMVPQAGSPLLDKADAKVCADAPVSGVGQRGISRPQGQGCDIGAVEVKP